ncbi:unnamed protein product [Dibothriocephalus latus]|uniref:Homeobox domain-containing protein n=1 Tax=Dibothriocephalus latus TaxID=60516 RepID=A0A3P6SB25_DIBLA|nr:unnamed protein product [Dibothriocephalus latus]
MNGNHAGYSLLSALPHPYTLPVFQGLSPNFQMVPGGSMNPACPMDFLAPLPLLFSSTLRAMGLPPLLSQCGELTEPLPPSLAGSTAVEIPQPNFQFEQPSLSSSPFRRADSRSQRMGGKWPLLRHEEASFTSSSCTEGSGEANVVDIEADWSTTESCFHETSLPERRRRMAMEGGRTEKGGAGDQVKTVEETSGSMHDTTVAKRRLEGESLSSSEAKRYRTTYSAYQTKVLEGMFEEERYISRPQRAQLAAQLQLPENTIKVWFQNRRMKEKRMSLMLPNFATGTTLYFCMVLRPDVAARANFSFVSYLQPVIPNSIFV